VLRNRTPSRCACSCGNQDGVENGPTLSQFGNIPLASSQHFSIDRITVGASSPAKRTVEDQFAPGRLSSADRLAAPSFESFPSGISFAHDDIETEGTVETRGIARS